MRRQQHGSHSPRRTESRTAASIALMATTLGVAVLSAGCVGAADLVRALGADPASVCVSVTTIYGKGAACRVGGAAEVKAGDGTVSVRSK